jgi:hypothetical protein
MSTLKLIYFLCEVLVKNKVQKMRSSCSTNKNTNNKYEWRVNPRWRGEGQERTTKTRVLSLPLCFFWWSAFFALGAARKLSPAPGLEARKKAIQKEYYNFSFYYSREAQLAAS